jgi:hypothetical protein
MADCKNSSTLMEKGLKISTKSTNKLIFRQLVGNLIYLKTTKQDLSFAVCSISRFMTHPKVEHWTPVKRILRYVKGTIDFGIAYGEIYALR